MEAPSKLEKFPKLEVGDQKDSPSPSDPGIGKKNRCRSPFRNKTNSNVGVAASRLFSFLDREPTSRPQGMEVRDNKQ